MSFSHVYLSGYFPLYAHICQFVCGRAACGFSGGLDSSAPQDEFIFLFVLPLPNVGRSQARYWTDRRDTEESLYHFTHSQVGDKEESYL